MPGVHISDPWALWPAYKSQKDHLHLDVITYYEYQAAKEILNTYKPEQLINAWVKTCNELEKITNLISEKGSNIIPQIEFDKIDSLSKDEINNLKETGCFVIKNIVPTDYANNLLNDSINYVDNNKDKITGWPLDNPCIKALYWSPSQIALRSHPNHLKTQKWINSLWSDNELEEKLHSVNNINNHINNQINNNDNNSKKQTIKLSSNISLPSKEDLIQPLTYADAIRIRHPGKPMHGLGPHIDAGSLCRWFDPTYRSVYDAVFSGNPEDLDLYDMTVRKYAKQECFPGPGQSSIFRTFQGWTALSPCGPRHGGLMLYPFVRPVIAYVLLRPFFKSNKQFSDDQSDSSDSSSDDDYLNPHSWSLITDPSKVWFPGTYKHSSQFLSSHSHPHLRLKKNLINIPNLNPGDSIWWHTDMIHAVEIEHSGDTVASVIYIAAVPSTEKNLTYIRNQAKAFLTGETPEDFKGEQSYKESDLIGYTGVKSISCTDGYRALGLI